MTRTAAVLAVVTSVILVSVVWVILPSSAPGGGNYNRASAVSSSISDDGGITAGSSLRGGQRQRRSLAVPTGSRSRTAGQQECQCQHPKNEKGDESVSSPAYNISQEAEMLWGMCDARYHTVAARHTLVNREQNWLRKASDIATAVEEGVTSYMTRNRVKRCMCRPKGPRDAAAFVHVPTTGAATVHKDVRQADGKVVKEDIFFDSEFTGDAPPPPNTGQSVPWLDASHEAAGLNGPYTDYAQRAIYTQQVGDGTCGTDRKMLLFAPWGYGLGADINIIVVNLVHAIISNRSYILKPSWHWSNIPQCNGRGFDCFFVAPSACNIDDAGTRMRWKYIGVTRKLKGVRHRVVKKESMATRDLRSSEGIDLLLPPGVTSSDVERQTGLSFEAWSYAQALRYLMRSAQPWFGRLLRQHLTKEFASWRQRVPAGRPVVATYFRNGDVKKRAELRRMYGCGQYDDRYQAGVAAGLMRAINATHVYASFDDVRAVDALRSVVPTGGDVLVSGFKYISRGRGSSDVRDDMQRQFGFEYIVRMSFVNLYLAVTADAWVGDDGSSWTRLINNLRYTAGRFYSIHIGTQSFTARKDFCLDDDLAAGECRRYRGSSNDVLTSLVRVRPISSGFADNNTHGELLSASLAAKIDAIYSARTTNDDRRSVRALQESVGEGVEWLLQHTPIERQICNRKIHDASVLVHLAGGNSKNEDPFLLRRNTGEHPVVSANSSVTVGWVRAAQPADAVDSYTHYAQAALFRSQGTQRNCSEVRVVVHRPSGRGLGDAIEGMTMDLVHAVAANRTLVIIPSWKWSTFSNCSGRGFMCYFVAPSECTVEDLDDSRSWHTTQSSLRAEGTRVVQRHHASSSVTGGTGEGLRLLLPPGVTIETLEFQTGLSFEAWSYAQALRYLMRSTQPWFGRLLQQHITKEFASWRQRVPAGRPVVATYFRNGDVKKRAELRRMYGCGQYDDRYQAGVAAGLMRAINATHVYASFDDVRAVEALRSVVPTGGDVLVSGFKYISRGRGSSDVRDDMQLSFVNLYLAVAADAWVGDDGSSWTRLINNLRYTAGHLWSVHVDLHALALKKYFCLD